MRHNGGIQLSVVVKVNKFDANCHSGKRKDLLINLSKWIFPKNIFEIVIKPYIVGF